MGRRNWRRCRSIFLEYSNPTSQLDRFDKDRAYVRKWIPELDTNQYPEPMVEHRMARLRCLETYKTALE